MLDANLGIPDKKKDSELERKISEDLTLAISINSNLEKVKEIYCEYLRFVGDFKNYDKKLFELNYKNYSEFIIQNSKNKNIS